MAEKTDTRFMEFKLGGQLYAIPLLTVKEVIPKPETTPVPNMPVFFEGMINLRGQILGVYNVRKKLAAKKRDENDKNHEVVIIIDHQGASVGIIVDEVTRVLRSEDHKFTSAPLKEDDPARAFIGDVIQAEGELVMTINVTELLDLNKYNQNLKTA